MSSSFQQLLALEKLMGKNALNRLPDSNDRQYIQTDPAVLDNYRICKSFLVGKCPYDMFSGTKEGRRCPRIHNERDKLVYDSAKSRGIAMPHHDYELDYLHDLEAFIREHDRQMQAPDERLQYTEEEREELAVLAQQIDDEDMRIALTSREISLLCKQGQMDRALELSRELQQSMSKRKRLNAARTKKEANIDQRNRQKLQMCKDCGAYLSKTDSDRRLADHFIGRIHCGYVEIRATIKSLKEKYEG